MDSRATVGIALGTTKLKATHPGTEPEAPAARGNVGQPILAGVSSSDMHSRGASPPWTVMTGTIRLGKGVRREAGSEES